MMDDDLLSGKYYFTLGLFCQLDGDDYLAIDYLGKAVDYFSRGEFSLNLYECYSRLSSAYNAVGDIEGAYFALRKAVEIEESLGQKNMYLSLFKYENDLLLSHEKELLMNQKARSRTSILLSVLVLSILIIGFVIYFYRRTLRIQVRESALNNRNDIIKLKEIQQSKMDAMVKDVISRLTRISYEFGDDNLTKTISAICSDLKASNGTDNWKEIDQFVPEFNSDFFVRLLKDYPNLSINERRLCVLLNMNLTTKQIAEITKQSPHSIDIARGRLRSKLGINDRSVSIQTFLSKYNH